MVPSLNKDEYPLLVIVYYNNKGPLNVTRDRGLTNLVMDIIVSPAVEVRFNVISNQT